MEAPKHNIYIDTVERFFLQAPLLRKTPDTGEDAFAPVVVLSTAETYKCKVSAYNDTLKSFEGKMPKSDEAGIEMWNTLYEDNLGAWTIFSCTRVPDKLEEKLFLSKDQVFKTYSSTELGIMYSNYITAVLNEPAVKHFDNTDPNGLSKVMDLIIKQSTVEDTAFFLSSYTTVAQAKLMRSLVEEVVALRQENGSSGQPSSDTNEI